MHARKGPKVANFLQDSCEEMGKAKVGNLTFGRTSVLRGASAKKGKHKVFSEHKHAIKIPAKH